MSEPQRDDPLHESIPELSPEVWQLPDDLDGLENAVAQQTGRVLHRRRRVRVAGRAALMAALYLLGVLTAHFWPASDARPGPSEPTPLIAEAADPEIERSSRAEKPAAERPQSVEEVERRARHGAPSRSAERWKRAGDLHLQQQSDVDSALRCYRRYLALMPDARHEPDDTWLLSRLKSDLN